LRGVVAATRCGTLLASGAQVTVASCTGASSRPTAGAVARLRAAVDPGSQTVVAVTSVDVLDSLMRGVPDDLLPALVRTPLVLPGDRAAAAAHERGWGGPLVVATSEDEAMVDALVAWHGTGARNRGYDSRAPRTAAPHTHVRRDRIVRHRCRRAAHRRGTSPMLVALLCSRSSPRRMRSGGRPDVGFAETAQAQIIEPRGAGGARHAAKRSRCAARDEPDRPGAELTGLRERRRRPRS
jgi:hypothetical protein